MGNDLPAGGSEGLAYERTHCGFVGHAGTATDFGNALVDDESRRPRDAERTSLLGGAVVVDDVPHDAVELALREQGSENRLLRLADGAPGGMAVQHDRLPGSLRLVERLLIEGLPRMVGCGQARAEARTEGQGGDEPGVAQHSHTEPQGGPAGSPADAAGSVIADMATTGVTSAASAPAKHALNTRKDPCGISETPSTVSAPTVSAPGSAIEVSPSESPRRSVPPGKKRSTPRETADQRSGATRPTCTWARASRVTIRHVISGRSRLVAIVSPAMLW